MSHVEKQTRHEIAEKAPSKEMLAPSGYIDALAVARDAVETPLVEARASMDVEGGIDAAAGWRIDDRNRVLAVIDIPRGGAVSAGVEEEHDNGRITLGLHDEFGLYLAGPRATGDSVRAMATGHAVSEAERPLLVPKGCKVIIGRKGMELVDHTDANAQPESEKLALGSVGSEVGPETSDGHLVVQVESTDGSIQLRNHGRNGLVVHTPTAERDVRRVSPKEKVRRFLGISARTGDARK